jgi:hypothetical protein
MHARLRITPIAADAFKKKEKQFMRGLALPVPFARHCKRLHPEDGIVFKNIHPFISPGPVGFTEDPLASFSGGAALEILHDRYRRFAGGRAR